LSEPELLTFAAVMGYRNPALTALVALYLCSTSIRCQEIVDATARARQKIYYFYSQHDDLDTDEGHLVTSKNLTLFFTISSLFFFILAKVAGPGFLPRRWRPDDPAAVADMDHCQSCRGLKAPRAHHCGSCGGCVKRMDHHCPFLDSCVGFENHAPFLVMLVLALAGIGHGLVPMATVLWLTFYGERLFYEPSITEIFSVIVAFSLACFLLIFLLALMQFQLKGLLHNLTLVEQLQMDEAASRGRNLENPYDLKSFWNNAGQIFGWRGRSTRGGTRFPTREGVDEAAFLHESRRQRLEREREMEPAIKRNGRHNSPDYDNNVFGSPRVNAPKGTLWPTVFMVASPSLALGHFDSLIALAAAGCWLYGSSAAAGDDDRLSPLACLTA